LESFLLEQRNQLRYESLPLRYFVSTNLKLDFEVTMLSWINQGINQFGWCCSQSSTRMAFC